VSLAKGSWLKQEKKPQLVVDPRTPLTGIKFAQDLSDLKKSYCNG
jgi:hypothetical protein